MQTRRIQQGRDRPVVLPLLPIGAPAVVVFLAEGEKAIWLAVLLAPALIVFAIHLFVLGLWQRVAVRRLRRRVDAALIRGDARSLRRAAAETAAAQRDWPGHGLWALAKGLAIMRHRAERAAGRST